MRWLNCIRGYKALFCLCLILVSTMSVAQESADWQSWHRQGEADFSYLFWDIYSSTLYAESSKVEIEDELLSKYNLALVIRYKREIKGKKLVEATEKQWEKQRYRHEQMDQWLADLLRIYPDVQEGDSLAFVVYNGTGQFYFKATESIHWQLIGSSFAAAFTNAFLSIWLGENTQYPDQRKQLLGEKS